MAITVNKSRTASAKSQVSPKPQNQLLYQEDVQVIKARQPHPSSHSLQKNVKENLPVIRKASQSRAESASQKVIGSRDITTGILSSVSRSSRTSPQLERLSHSHASKKRRLQPYILVPTRKDISRHRDRGDRDHPRTLNHTSFLLKERDDPDHDQKQNDPKSRRFGEVQIPIVRRKGVPGVKPSSLAAALGQQFEHNDAHASASTRTDAVSTDPVAKPSGGKRKEEIEESKRMEKASALRSALDSAAPRRRKRKRSPSRQTRESSPDELLLAPGAVAKVDEELADRPALDSSLESTMALVGERGRRRSTPNARDPSQTGSETDDDDLPISSYSPRVLLKTQVEDVVQAARKQKKEGGDIDSRVQLRVHSASHTTTTSGPPRSPRSSSPSRAPNAPKESGFRSRSHVEERRIERVEADSDEDEEIRAQLDESDSEAEAESSRSVYHAYVQPPPSLADETSSPSPPSYFARERPILLHGIQQSDKDHARPSAGQYTAPLGWEDLCRVPEKVMRVRGVHGVRSETRAERYVRVLESTYGVGDIWRGHGRKPPRVSGVIGQTSSGMGAAGRIKNRLQAIKASTIIESSSEETSSEEERTEVSVINATRTTATREKEHDLSDASSADPPAPVTPPDEVTVTLPATSIAASDPGDALDNMEHVSSAPIIVSASVNGDDGNKDDGSKEKLAGATPFVHKPPTQTPEGVPIATINSRNVVRPGFANEVRLETGSAVSPASLHATAPSIQEASGSDAEIATGRFTFSSTAPTPFGGEAEIGTAPESSLNLTLNSNSKVLSSSRNLHSFNATSSTATTINGSNSNNNSNKSLQTDSCTNSFQVPTSSSLSSVPIPALGNRPVHQIRWHNTTEWNGVLRKVVSGKKPVSPEDLVYVDQTMLSIEELVHGLGGQGGSEEKRIVQNLVFNIKEYLLLLRDLPDEYIPYNDQFGLRRRAAELLKAAYGLELGVSVPK